MSVTANENGPLNRYEAVDAIDALRRTLKPGSAEDNALAPVVRDLWDNYPLEDAQDSLKGARLACYALPTEVADAVQAVLDRTVDDADDDN